MSYPSDLTNTRWALLEPVFNPPSKRGPKCGKGLRKVVNATLYISHTRTTELMLADLARQDVTGRLELVRVDRGVTGAAAHSLGRGYDLEVRRAGWDDKQPVFRPIRHAWRVEVAHGRLGRARRLAKSFENTTTSAIGSLHVACIATALDYLSRVGIRMPPRGFAV